MPSERDVREWVRGPYDAIETAWDAESRCYLARWVAWPSAQTDGETREHAIRDAIELAPTFMAVLADIPRADVRDAAEVAKAVALDAEKKVAAFEARLSSLENVARPRDKEAVREGGRLCLGCFAGRGPHWHTVGVCSFCGREIGLGESFARCSDDTVQHERCPLAPAGATEPPREQREPDYGEGAYSDGYSHGQTHRDEDWNEAIRLMPEHLFTFGIKSLRERLRAPSSDSSVSQPTGPAEPERDRLEREQELVEHAAIVRQVLWKHVTRAHVASQAVDALLAAALRAAPPAAEEPAIPEKHPDCPWPWRSCRWPECVPCVGPSPVVEAPQEQQSELAGRLERAWAFLCGAEADEDGLWFGDGVKDDRGRLAPFGWRSRFRPLFAQVLAALRAPVEAPQVDGLCFRCMEMPTATRVHMCEACIAAVSPPEGFTQTVYEAPQVEQERERLAKVLKRLAQRADDNMLSISAADVSDLRQAAARLLRTAPQQPSMADAAEAYRVAWQAGYEAARTAPSETAEP